MLNPAAGEQIDGELIGPLLLRMRPMAGPGHSTELLLRWYLRKFVAETVLGTVAAGHRRRRHEPLPSRDTTEVRPVRTAATDAARRRLRVLLALVAVERYARAVAMLAVLRAELSNRNPGAASGDPDPAHAAPTVRGAGEGPADEAVALRARELESAMVTGRTWPAGEFRREVVAHPALGAVARRLVWVALDTAGEVTTSFRVTDRGGLLDEWDRVPVLAGCVVAVAHPLHLGARLPAWVRRFAAQRVRQPFEQLDRSVHRLTEREAAATSLRRFADRMVTTDALLRLVDAGWRLSTPADGGVHDHLFRAVGADLRVLVVLDDGIDAEDPQLIPEQVLAAVELTDRPRRHWMHRCGDTRFAVLDPVTASEILRDLEALVR